MTKKVDSMAELTKICVTLKNKSKCNIMGSNPTQYKAILHLAFVFLDFPLASLLT